MAHKRRDKNLEASREGCNENQGLGLTMGRLSSALRPSAFSQSFSADLSALHPARYGHPLRVVTMRWYLSRKRAKILVTNASSA